jgi:hypothetical protein
MRRDRRIWFAAAIVGLLALAFAAQYLGGGGMAELGRQIHGHGSP